MTYSEKGERVTLEMTQHDYEMLVMILGFATGKLEPQQTATFWLWIQFVNELNRTNPHFSQYEIPEEYSK
jgi:hypothetical protein